LAFPFIKNTALLPQPDTSITVIAFSSFLFEFKIELRKFEQKQILKSLFRI